MFDRVLNSTLTIRNYRTRCSAEQLQKQPPEVFCKKKGVLKNFATFTGKYPNRSLILIKFQTEPCNFIKKEILALVFFCEFCEIFGNTFFTEHSGRLLMQVLWENLSQSQENTLKSIFRMTYSFSKKTSIAGFFLRVFATFSEYIFYRAPLFLLTSFQNYLKLQPKSVAHRCLKN